MQTLKRPNQRIDLIICLLLFSSGVLMRIWILHPTGFDGLYGQDPYAYYDFAHELGNAINDGRAPGVFFWPLGYPVLLLVTFTFVGDQPIVGQTLNIVLGAALPVLIYLLGHLIGLKRAGALIAGIVMAVCGQALQSSLVIMSDMPALFWATASAISLTLYWKRYKQLTWWLVLAFALLSVASITRWIYLILFVPWGLSILILWRGRIHWKALILAFLPVLMIITPQLVYSRLTASPGLNHEWTNSWALNNAFERQFTNVDGHFSYAQINAVYYAQAVYAPYFVAPLLSLFIPIGMLKRGLIWLVLLISWMILPYLFLCGIPYQNIRFILIVFPPVSLLVGAGMENTIELLQKSRTRHFVFHIIGFAIATFGAGQTLITARQNIQTFIERHQGDKAVAEWVAQSVPDDSTVYTFGLTLTLKHYTKLTIFELYYETPETLQARWVQGQDDYLLLNLWDIEHQWAGREPDIAYQWFFDVRGLTRLDQHGYYTLFRIKG